MQYRRECQNGYSANEDDKYRSQTRVNADHRLPTVDHNRRCRRIRLEKIYKQADQDHGFRFGKMLHERYQQNHEDD